jgi:hypothetical protein
LATLLLENGPEKGKGLELHPGATYTLGRDPNCDLVLNGDLVSRHHVRLKEFKGGYFVKDLDSLNGVYINDQRVTQAELKPGDKLQIGDALLTFLGESLAKAKEEKILGGYRLLERVGRGGMGTVYRAIQISLDREVALKLLSPELVKDKNFVAQFFREARAAGQLNHPHIVQVYDVGQEGEDYYYSMEFVRGGSLEDRLRKEGKLAPAEALRIALEAATALEYAESRHIVHRDIKPDNLMLAEDGRVRVADLGLALSLKSGADQKGQPILGTPHFISPEQALRRDVDIRSDIYSLGATLYRMLTGETLFKGATAEEIVKKAVREEPRPLREVNAAVPERIAALVHRMVQKDPDARFASAKELRETLQRLLHQPARTKVTIAAGVVAVVAIGVAITMSLKKPKETIVVQHEDADAERKKAFALKSEADKRKTELDAVRVYLDIVERAPERAQQKEQLAAWLKTYDYLEIPERDRARGRIQSIDDSVKREEAARVAAEAARAKRLEELRASVAEPLAKNDYAAAFRAAAAIEPEKEADPAAKGDVAAAKLKLIEEAQKRVDDDAKRRRDDIEALASAGDLRGAATRCDEAAAAFPAPPAELPEPWRATLAALHDGFGQRKGELEATVRARSESLMMRDAERLARATGPELRRQVLQLDYAGAADQVEKILGELETDAARDELAPVARALRHGAELFARTVRALEAGSLPAEPAIRLAGQERGGDLVGFDKDKKMVKLKAQTRTGGGSVSVNMSLTEFASADGLRQLVFNRMELQPEERADLADLMTLVEVFRWIERVAPLADRVGRYDENEGWGDGMREGLEVPANLSFANDVHAVMKDAGGTARAAQILARADEEEKTQVDLLAALEPFFKSNATISWSAAADALRKVVAEHKSTLLVRFARPWITGT